jgi:poly(3-hydroxybutyrate) depolymerase
MNPDRHANSHYDYFKDLIKGDDASAEAHRKFYDEYNAVLDMDADYYLETIQTVFQDFKLVNGTWDVKGVDGKVERVRPQDIKTTALMTVEGELDDISGSGQTRAAQDLCSGVPANERQHLEVEGAGHYGIFSGRRWRDIVYPQLVKFIANHAPQARAKPAAKPSAKPAAKATVKTTAKSASSAQNKAAGKKPLKVTAKVAPKAAIKTTWVSAKKKA